jgi:potassium-transporting ATPase KdpC subunit
MLQHFRPALVIVALFTLLTGFAYPLALTGVASLAFPYQAGGELIRRNGKIIGSALIGQNFAQAKYFHPRPSATTAPDPKDPNKTIDAPYNADNSSGSNLGPTSKALIDRVETGVASLRKAGWTGEIPADAVTTSASGLDPDISTENALAQAPRVAKARGLAEEKVRGLVFSQVRRPWLGFVGEARINVLRLNLALNALK